MSELMSKREYLQSLGISFPSRGQLPADLEKICADSGLKFRSWRQSKTVLQETKKLTMQELREMPTISIDEAAAVLGISRQHAYRSARIGEIPSIKIGGRFIVPTIQLRRMLGDVTE